MSAEGMDLISVSGNWVWPQGREPLLVTNHGDHLYGTATTSRGRVIYAVLTDVADDSTTVRVENGVRVFMIGFGDWVDRCSARNPRALEAMFANDPMIETLGTLRDDYEVASVKPTAYLRAITLLSHSEEAASRVHALRLAWNLSELTNTGRFDPSLHPLQVDQYRKVADRFEGDELLDIALKVAGG